MALTSRGRRKRQTLTKRRPKTRAPNKAAAKRPASPKRARRSPARGAAGMVETALAAFAHEVRTPLTGILAVSDLLATSDLGERERRWADTIKAGAEHLAALATLFVDAARNGDAGVGLRDEFFDLRALARSIGDSLAGRAAAKGLDASVDIGDGLPAFVTGDPIRLRAALENLIDNAVKFTAQGRVGLSVTASKAAKGRVKVSFAVADSGIGLTLAEIKRLFRPFSQANLTIATRFGGAGLGLFSVRQIARAMDGDVIAAARRGGGATFTLTVTLTLAAESEPAIADAGRTPAGQGRGLHMLGVEDNPFGRVVLNTILTELGHRAEFVSRGEDAAARVAQGGFDAVLMDMVLPGIGGIEAIRRIRALPPAQAGIPVIGISGRGGDEAAARSAGADAFLLKPISPRALATVLLAAKRRAATAT
jgi:signal transduction histidine kinase/CheY-like chemotaxis protein